MKLISENSQEASFSIIYTDIVEIRNSLPKNHNYRYLLPLSVFYIWIKLEQFKHLPEIIFHSMEHTLLLNLIDRRY